MIDLREHLRDGDHVVSGQACGEPRALVRALGSQAGGLGRIRVFVGIRHTADLSPELPATLQLESYTAAGGNRALMAGGRLDIVPSHYSELPRRFAYGEHRADAALVLLSPPDMDGWHRLGCGDDYIAAAAKSARTVIAEINPRVPAIPTATGFRLEELAATVRTDGPLAVAPAASEPSPMHLRIAARVAELVPDGATIQVGVGTLPTAIVRALAHHRDLGLHSGLINDDVADLIENGVITGRHKAVDQGRHVAASLIGSERLLTHGAQDPALDVRGISYVHDPATLAAQCCLVAINSALQVDLSGQINTESIDGRYVGSVGGGIDFARGAVRSRGGLSIIALPARSRAGSSIVGRLSGPASIPRADADVVVTEHGVAHLRGASLAQRRARLLAVCDPELADEVERHA
jgi:acyl-CoA hydrolase